MGTAIAFGIMATVASAQDLPPLEQKDTYTVGFPQMESNNALACLTSAPMGPN